ncbi:MAG: hypothetical protein SGBAC_009530 [Bacillariaceae sp.]
MSEHASRTKAWTAPLDKPEETNKKSSGCRSLPSTASSISSDACSNKGQAKKSTVVSVDDPPTGEGSESKLNMNLLADAAEGESDSAVSDEKETQAKIHNGPRHQEGETPQAGQPPLRQIPNAEISPEVQVAERIIFQVFQSMMNQQSNSNHQTPNLMLIQQLLTQYLANPGSTVTPPQPFGFPQSVSSPAELFLSQLSSNGSFQNSTEALDFIQQLQQLIIQQQLAGNASNPPAFNPLTSVAALLQEQNRLQEQQNQLQIQHQLSSLLAMSQFTNHPGLRTAQDPRSASAFPIVAAPNVLNPATRSINQSLLQRSTRINQQDPTNYTIEPTGRPALPLATDSDEANLATYQCLLRKQIELFETREDDIYLKAQGRNTPIQIGQVGIRCRHCASMSKSKRLEGSASLYSKSLNGIYQVALNMGRLHFLNNSCPMMPDTTKNQLRKLKELPRKVARGRKYWKETLEAQGVVEEKEFLRFKPHHLSPSS